MDLIKRLPKHFLLAQDLETAIYNLSSISAIGGGNVFLSLDYFNWLKPLLTWQPYLTGVLARSIEGGSQYWNLNYATPRPNEHICAAQLRFLGLPLDTAQLSWLQVPNKRPQATTIITWTDVNRIERGANFDWQKFIKAREALGTVGFLGNNRDYGLFAAKYCRGEQKLLPIPSNGALIDAEIMAGAELVVGGHPAYTAIAEGLKLPLLHPSANQRHIDLFNRPDNYTLEQPEHQAITWLLYMQRSGCSIPIKIQDSWHAMLDTGCKLHIEHEPPKANLRLKQVLASILPKLASNDKVIFCDRPVLFSKKIGCDLAIKLVSHGCAIGLLSPATSRYAPRMFAFRADFLRTKLQQFPDVYLTPDDWMPCLDAWLHLACGAVENMLYLPPKLVSAPKQNNDRHEYAVSNHYAIRQLEAVHGVKLTKPLSKIARVDPQVIIDYYRKVKPAGRRPISWDSLVDKALSNTPRGLGDTVIITDLPRTAAEQGEVRFISCDPTEHLHYKTLMRYHPHASPPTDRVKVYADQLCATYDLGNGHTIQRLQRAFNLRVTAKPTGCIIAPGHKIPGRVALHFEAGIHHASWQRRHIHPRARQLYPEAQAVVQRFIHDRPDLEFYQLGAAPIPFENVTNLPDMLLEQTIELLQTCEYFVGIMSGPMHLATALGCKCVVVVNFPEAGKIYLPTLVDINQVESEWFYPQNVHLHQDSAGPLVPKFSLVTLEQAFAGEVYPYWSDDYLELVNEKI